MHLRPADTHTFNNGHIIFTVAHYFFYRGSTLVLFVLFSRKEKGQRSGFPSIFCFLFVLQFCQVGVSFPSIILRMSINSATSRQHTPKTGATYVACAIMCFSLLHLGLTPKAFRLPLLSILSKYPLMS